jgi:hypothetical protein
LSPAETIGFVTSFATPHKKNIEVIAMKGIRYFFSTKIGFLENLDIF